MDITTALIALLFFAVARNHGIRFSVDIGPRGSRNGRERQRPGLDRTPLLTQVLNGLRKTS